MRQQGGAAASDAEDQDHPPDRRGQIRHDFKLCQRHDKHPPGKAVLGGIGKWAISKVRGGGQVHEHRKIPGMVQPVKRPVRLVDDKPQRDLRAGAKIEIVEVGPPGLIAPSFDIMDHGNHGFLPFPVTLRAMRRSRRTDAAARRRARSRSCPRGAATMRQTTPWRKSFRQIAICPGQNRTPPAGTEPVGACARGEKRQTRRNAAPLEQPSQPDRTVKFARDGPGRSGLPPPGPLAIPP